MDEDLAGDLSMTRDEQVEWLALRISPQRTGWAWLCYDSSAGICVPAQGSIICKQCQALYGHGPRPAPLDQPECTLRLREWASKQLWWYEKQLGFGRFRKKWGEEITLNMACVQTTTDSGTVALTVFMRILDAEHSHADKETKA